MGRLKGTVTLYVGPWNLAARRLYESYGFVKVREFTGTFNGRDVAVLTMETSPRSLA
jgi:ribosomal protein S18 acetylase RimI-like enzyme